MIASYFNNLAGPNVNVSPFLQAPNSPTILNGCNISYKLGAILKDTGYKNIGSALQASKSIGGLFNFRQSAAVQKMLATVDDSSSDDTQLFYSTGGAWTEITDAETAWANKAGIDVDMESFIGYCFMVGYGSTDGFINSSSLAGTTFSTSTNVTDMPDAKYIKRYRDRIYIANCDIAATAYPFRVYFSSVPSAGAISWTTASDFIDVDYSEEIKGINEAWDRLLIFTEFSTYLYDQSQKKKVWDIGGFHKTIAKQGPFIYFANGDGVWRSSGGQPENISGNVIDFFRDTDPSGWESALVDEEYHIYLGNVTVDGIAYANLLMTFNIPTQTWRWRELADNATKFAKYTSSGVSHLWFGDVSGDVHEKGKYTDATLLTDDDGTAITANFELAPIHLNSFKLEKEIISLTAYADKAMGLKLKARVLNRNERTLTPYLPMGELTGYVNKFDVNVGDGILLQISGSEYGKSRYFSFYGLELEVDAHSEILTKQ